MKVNIRVDNRTLEVPEGVPVLKACLDNGIYIPNLCYLEGSPRPPASCRLCFVEVSGVDGPVTACTLKTRAGMEVFTDTPAVRRLQRSGLRLLLSVHDVDCRNCPANRNCELQRMARFLKVGLKARGLETYLKAAPAETGRAGLAYHPDRCVLCGRCIAVSTRLQGRPVFAFSGRGFDTAVRFYGLKGGEEIPRETCAACEAACPVGALTLEG